MAFAVLVERTLLVPEVLRTGVASWVDPAASWVDPAASWVDPAASLRVASVPALAAA